MLRTRVVFCAATLAVAAMIAVPAAGQALGTKEFPVKRFPKVFRNGVKLSVREPAEAVGSIKLHNGLLGDFTCQSIFTGVTYNETTEGTEKGFLNTTGYSTSGCEAQVPCRVKNTKGEEVVGNFLTAESPPTVEPEHSSEAHSTGITSLPWTGELIERETGIEQLLTHHVKIWFVSPPPAESVGKPPNCMGIAIPFEDAEATTEKEAGYELAPVAINGTKNGLKPSKEEFAGEEGLTEKGFPQTGRLKSGIGDGFLTALRMFTGGLAGGWELITTQ
jgi:hypothetical protein